MRFSDWSSDVCSSDLLPLPHLLDEILAAVVGALVLPLLELALDDHLRRDAGMIGADDPQSILAAQALVADEHVLQRVVERMADVERAGDVRRRVDDREGLRVGALRAIEAAALPFTGPLDRKSTRLNSSH